MAGRPREQTLRAVLKRLAVQELGDGAESIDFIVHRVASGHTVTKLAQELGEATGEEASRGWVSWVCNRLTPDAKARIVRARKDAAIVLVEQSVAMPGAPTKTTTEVQSNRLRTDVRETLAKAFDPKVSHERSTTAHLSLGQLHIEALRAQKGEPAQIEPVDGERFRSNDQLPSARAAGDDEKPASGDPAS
jgi:hypothetical protein